MLIDEIHTPDSSRYFYENGYSEDNIKVKVKGSYQRFVREWLIDNNFQGLPGQNLPEMTSHFVSSVETDI